MRRLIAIFLVLMMMCVTVYAADETEDTAEPSDAEYQQFGKEFQDTVKKIKDKSDKIKKLIDAYGKVKLDFVKTEDVTITDQDGNGVSCELEAYYDSDYVSDLTTSADGKFKGNFNHFQRFPGKLISYRLSQCKCRVTSIEHRVSFPSFSEHINRLKDLLGQEVSKYGEKKGKKLAEEAIKKGFEAVDAAELAGPFLGGFSIGADLGAPFGEALTKGLTDMLELSVNQNKWKRQALKGSQDALEPANYRRITARWWDFGRTDPILANIWNIKVKCDPKISGALSDVLWAGPPKKSQESTGTTGGTETGTATGTGTTSVTPQEPYQPTPEQERAKAEREYREQQRREQEKRDADDKARRDAEERKQAEERAKREAEIQKATEEVKSKCKICDPIAQKVADAETATTLQEAKINSLSGQVDLATAKSDSATKDLERAKQKLSDFDNPMSWAESDGRRITSSDLIIDRQVSRENWQRWLDGEQTAQQTSDNWKSYNDAARQKAKEEYRARLQSDITSAQAAADQSAADAASKQGELASAKKGLDTLKKTLATLKAQLDDCIKKCKSSAREIALNPQMAAEDLVGTTPTVPVVSGPCQRYEKLLSRYRMTPIQYESADEESLTRLDISSGMKEAIESEKRKCKQATGGSSTVSRTVPQTPREYVPQQPTTPTSTTTPVAVSCPDFCASKGMITEQKDWSSYVLGYLNSNGECAKSATIDLGSYLRSGNCICYPSSEPSIQISGEKLVCNTQCGAVPCGSSTQCSCGERCVLKVECRWGGWRKVSDNAYQPIAGAVATQ